LETAIRLTPIRSAIVCNVTLMTPGGSEPARAQSVGGVDPVTIGRPFGLFTVTRRRFL
jgi:hypothetical protein